MIRLAESEFIGERSGNVKVNERRDVGACLYK